MPRRGITLEDLERERGVTLASLFNSDIRAEMKTALSEGKELCTNLFADDDLERIDLERGEHVTHPPQARAAGL